MNSSVTFYSLIMLLVIFISSLSQVLLKKSTAKTYDSIIKEYFNPYVVFAYCIFFVASFVNIYVYKVVPLSLGSILETTSYVYVTAFGVVLFKEKINKKKVVALALIICGIVVYGLFGV